MNYTHNLTLLGTELQEIRDVVRLGDTIPTTTTTNNMTTAIEKLKEAVATVRAATGDNSIFAQVELGGHGIDDYTVAYSVYRRGHLHTRPTLADAISAAIAFDSKAERMAKAAELRARAAELEAGVK